MCLNFLRLSYIKLALGPEVEAKWRMHPVREIHFQIYTFSQMFLRFFVAFLSHVSEFRGNTSDYDRSFVCSFAKLWYSPSNYNEGLKMSLLNNK